MVASLRRNRGGGWWYPCDEIARNGSFFARNHRGRWLLCDEIARDGGGILAAKLQGTVVVSLQGTVDEGGDGEKIKKMQREVASL